MKYFFAVLRILIAAIFIVSGFEKIISPYQNFLYVIQSYEILPSGLDELIARFFPWIELLVGVFVFLGLWTRGALMSLLALLLIFLGVVSQAMARNLPLSECGCFGELFSFPLHVVFVFDSSLVLLTLVLLRNITAVSRWSLDQYFKS